MTLTILNGAYCAQCSAAPYFDRMGYIFDSERKCKACGSRASWICQVNVDAFLETLKAEVK